MRRSPPPPLWFLCLVAAALGLLLRALQPPSAAGPAGGLETPPAMALWGFLIALGSAIWKGLEIAGKVTLEVLKWMVANLSVAVVKLGNALKELGRTLLAAGRGIWKFFEFSYERVIRPTFLKLWHWFDRARAWLDRTVGPVLRGLKRLRDTLQRWWRDYVRPWLDLIDVTRRMLRVLGSMGIGWARALDRRLAAIEERIERPFRLLVGKLNEVISLVNRVVTVDGYIQKLVNIRSLSRDVRETWRLAVNWRARDVTEAEWAETRRRLAPRTTEEILQDARRALESGDGRFSALTSEHVASLARLLSSHGSV